MLEAKSALCATVASDPPQRTQKLKTRFAGLDRTWPTYPHHTVLQGIPRNFTGDNFDPLSWAQCDAGPDSEPVLRHVNSECLVPDLKTFPLY